MDSGESNKEIRTLFNEQDVTAVIESRKLSWLGHILRREELSLLIRAMDRRPLGRPTLRCNDQTMRDLHRYS